MGTLRKWRVPYFGVLIIRVLLFRVLYYILGSPIFISGCAPAGAPPLPPFPFPALVQFINDLGIAICVSPPLWSGTSFLLLRPHGITIYVSPLPPRGTGHPFFSCCPGSVYVQLYRHNDICLPASLPACGTPAAISFPPPPPVERDILPSPAATCFPPPPGGTGHPSFSCCPGSVYIQYIGITIYVSPLPPLWNGTSFLLMLPWSVVLLHPFSSLKPLYN